MPSVACGATSLCPFASVASTLARTRPSLKSPNVIDAALHDAVDVGADRADVAEQVDLYRVAARVGRVHGKIHAQATEVARRRLVHQIPRDQSSAVRQVAVDRPASRLVDRVVAHRAVDDRRGRAVAEPLRADRHVAEVARGRERVELPGALLQAGFADATRLDGDELAERGIEAQQAAVRGTVMRRGCCSGTSPGVKRNTGPAKLMSNDGGGGASTRSMPNMVGCATATGGSSSLAPHGSSTPPSLPNVACTGTQLGTTSPKPSSKVRSPGTSPACDGEKGGDHHE